MDPPRESFFNVIELNGFRLSPDLSRFIDFLIFFANSAFFFIWDLRLHNICAKIMPSCFREGDVKTMDSLQNIFLTAPVYRSFLMKGDRTRRKIKKKSLLKKEK